jgi:hypothetical protein
MNLRQEQLLWKIRSLPVEEQKRWSRLLYEQSPKGLKERIREAASWGTPDRDSIGMSHGELCGLLSEALQYIEELERR